MHASISPVVSSKMTCYKLHPQLHDRNHGLSLQICLLFASESVAFALDTKL